MQVVQHQTRLFKNSSFVFLPDMFPTQLPHLPFPPHPCFLQGSLSEMHRALVFFRAWFQSHWSPCQSWRRTWEDRVWALEERHLGFWQGINYKTRIDFFYVPLAIRGATWVMDNSCADFPQGPASPQVRVSPTNLYERLVWPGRSAIQATGLVS